MSGAFSSPLHQFVEGEADELFGLGTRDQDAGVEVEIERAKGPVPEDVLNRFAVESSPRGQAQGGDRIVVGG